MAAQMATEDTVMAIARTEQAEHPIMEVLIVAQEDIRTTE